MRFHRLLGERTAGEPDICVLSSQGASDPAILPRWRLEFKWPGDFSRINWTFLWVPTWSCGIKFAYANANEKVWPREALVLPSAGPSSLGIAQGPHSPRNVQNTYSFPKTHCKIFSVMPTLNIFSLLPLTPQHMPWDTQVSYLSFRRRYENPKFGPGLASFRQLSSAGDLMNERYFTKQLWVYFSWWKTD